MSSIMSDLQEAILYRLKEKGLQVDEINFQDLIDGRINIQRPAVNITFNNATVQKVTINTYKFKTTVSLIVVVNYTRAGIQAEGQRKALVYDLLESISNYLMIQDFGLPLENPLFPLGFNNITPAKLAKAGYQIYELKFWCSWDVTKEDQYPNSVALESILSKYSLESGYTGAQPPQGSDLIILQ